MPCVFNPERPFPFHNLDPGCQFNVEEDELGRFDDKNWCEFHLPMEGTDASDKRKADWDKEKQRQFNERIFDKIADAKNKKARVEQSEEKLFSFLGDYKKEEEFCDLSGVVFPSLIDFKRIEKFPEILFFNAQFHKKASFDRATFCDWASFENAKFEGPASFVRAKFKEEAWFENAKFKEEAGFAEAIFDGPTWFENVKFEGPTRFAKAQFEGPTRFAIAKFKGEVNFASAGFNEKDDEVNFASVTFEKQARFANARFEGLASFARAKFKRSASFDNAKFKGKANFSARSNLPDEEENSVAFFSGRISFTDATFKGETIFNNRHFLDTTVFSRCAFQQAPSFHNSQLHQDTNFKGANFQDTESHGAERAYRTLKLAMENARARREEGMFYELEQQSLREQRKKLIKKSLPRQLKKLKRRVTTFGLIKKLSKREQRKKFRKRFKIARSAIRKRVSMGVGAAVWDFSVSWMYEKTSNYGRSSGRPLIGLVLLTLLSGVFYDVVSYNHMDSEGKEACAESKPFKFAVQQVVRPFSAWFKTGQDFICVKISDDAVLIHFATALQSIFSVAFLALFLLALRWRFKRG